jgi:hypothetical protein
MSDPRIEDAHQEAFKAFVARAREAFGKLNLKLTSQALAEQKLHPDAICVALAMQGINLAVLSIAAANLDFDDFKDEFERAVRIKSAGAGEARRKARPS